MKIFPLSIVPNDTSIDFMRWRRLSVAVTVALLIAALTSIALLGFNYGLDFTGGTVVEARYERAADIPAIRSSLESHGFEGAQVQTFGAATSVLIRAAPLEPRGSASGSQSASGVAELQQALEQPGNPSQIVSTEFIGPQVGSDLATNALYACVFVTIGFLIYISVRFEYKFAVVACLATLMTVSVVAAYFAWSQREFDLTTLAGLLAAMGFSINDTIVVLDRVRENFRSMRAGPLEVINASINQTLSRTVITSLVYFLSCFSLYLFAGSSLEGLAVSNMITAVAAILVTTFFAAPMLALGPFAVSKQDLMPKAKVKVDLSHRP